MSKYISAVLAAFVLFPALAFAQVPPPEVITTTSLPNTTFGSTVSDPVITTSGVTPFVWTVTGLPDGVSFDPSTQIISGTPVANCASGTIVYTPHFHVQDAVGQTADASFTWNITGGTFSYSRTPVGNGAIANIAVHISGVMGVDYCPGHTDYSLVVGDNNDHYFYSPTYSHALGESFSDTWMLPTLPIGGYVVIADNCTSRDNELEVDHSVNRYIFFTATLPTITANPLLQPGIVGSFYSTTLTGINGGAFPAGRGRLSSSISLNPEADCGHGT